MHIGVEVWTSSWDTGQIPSKAAEGLFVFVAIDEEGNPRPLSK